MEIQHYYDEMKQAAEECSDSDATSTVFESVIDTVSKVLHSYRKHYILPGTSSYLSEVARFPKLCRGNYINALDGFIGSWISDTIAHVRPYLSGPFERTYPDIIKIFCSTGINHFNGPRDNSIDEFKSFKNSIESIDKAEALVTFLTASFLTPESYLLCSSFIESAQAARKKWCEPFEIRENHIWCNLCLLSSIIHKECKMSLPLFPDTVNSCNLHFTAMPHFLGTIIPIFKDCIGSYDIESQENLLNKVLRCYSKHDKPKKSCSSPLEKFRHKIIRQRFTESLCDKLRLDVEEWTTASRPAKKAKTFRNATVAETTNQGPGPNKDVIFTGGVARQPPDGHCLFHCFNYSLHRQATVELALVLRTSLAGYMEENKDMILPNGLSVEQIILSDKDVERHAVDEEGHPSFNSYLRNLQDGTKIYGGQLEIFCLSKMLQKTVIIFNRVERSGRHVFVTNDNKTYHPNDEDSNGSDVIGLIFQPTPPHYDVLENYTPLSPQTESIYNEGHSAHINDVEHISTPRTPIRDTNLDSTQSKWRQLLSSGLIVQPHHLCQAETGAEFACMHNRDSTDFMNKKKFLPYILKKTKASEPYEWDLLDETGLNVMEHIVEDEDQGPSKEWNGWYRHPNLEDISQIN